MAERPNTSGALSEREAVGAPDESCAAARHDSCRAAYQAGCRCPGAVSANRAYYREYNRVGRELAAWRDRQNEYARHYQRRLRADPHAQSALNTKRRRQAAARRARARHDARHEVDAVVVQRLVNGEAVQHNRAERLEAVRRLRNHGTSYPQIAARLHTTERQVHRDMTHLGLIDSTGAVA